jgi:hypothetical protein
MCFLNVNFVNHLLVNTIKKKKELMQSFFATNKCLQIDSFKLHWFMINQISNEKTLVRPVIEKCVDPIQTSS